MILDSRAGGLAEVEADVVALCPERRGGRVQRLCEELPELDALVRVEIRRRGDVPERHDHEVPAAVGVEVEDGKAALAAMHDQRVLVALRCLGAEDAAVGALAPDVGHAPRGPETLHATEATCRSNEHGAGLSAGPVGGWMRG